MLTICEDNRQEIENEYLALLLNKNDLFNFINDLLKVLKL